MKSTMSKMLIFTVTDYGNGGKPTVYAQLVPAAYKHRRELAEALIRDWIEDNDVPEVTNDDLENLNYDMRSEGYAWWNEDICFELTKVNR